MVKILTFYQWFMAALIVRYIRSYLLDGITLEVHVLIWTRPTPTLVIASIYRAWVDVLNFTQLYPLHKL